VNPFCRIRLSCLLVLLLNQSPIKAGSIDSLESLRAERSRLAAQQRRLIMNNDGCDCLYFPRNLKATPENFLAQRTTALAGTQVNGIAYCSISSGFGQFTHDTKKGAVLEHSPSDFGIAPSKRNIARDLIDMGQDPLRLVTGFCRTNGMESYFSIRMNDTHDVAHTKAKPYFLFPKLKTEHPELLVGDEVKRTPFGRWSSVNYALPQVREMAFQYILEVCRNYDIDGVELDYFRHLCYFPSVANGGKASAAECSMITELMRRIRRMTEVEGLRRGRPILLSIRTPDSADFCRDMGLDVEQWLKEGLVDLFIPSGYFRLHDWQHSIRLGHRHGVKVLPCLTDARVRNESRFRRKSIESYRARAANAWAAGADGLQLFNQFDPHSQVWNELGDPDALRFRSKLYFVTTTDGTGNRWLADGERYRTRPLLSPRYPLVVRIGQTNSTHIMVSEDLVAARQAGHSVNAHLHVELPDLEQASQLDVMLNGHRLRGGRIADGWLDLPLADELRKGRNDIAVTLKASPPMGDKWSLEFDGKSIPTRPWKADPGSERIVEKIEDGAIFIADRGTEGGDYRYHRFAWGADSDQECVIEARVKVAKGESYLIFSNGRSAERLRFADGDISFYHNRRLRWKMDTTSDYHDYRIVMQKDDIRVFVDGVLRIDGTGKFAPRTGYRNEIGFGAANSTDMGEAWWQSVKVRAERKTRNIRDIALTVNYLK
jgi:hypothetical protein